MAEQLGEAVLSLSVDLEGFKKQLDTARSIAEKQKPVSFKFDVSNAQQQLRKLEGSAKVLESQLNKLLNAPLNLNAKAGKLGQNTLYEELGADALVAGKKITDFTRDVINGKTALATGTAALQQQGKAFLTLAANVSVTSAEFRNFTQAAAQAGQKQLFAGLKEIAALQSLFKLGGAGELSSFKGTEDLLAFSRQIGNTPAAINLYTQALQQALSVTSATDVNFAKLTAEIERQASALERAQSAASRYNQIFGAQPKALPPGRGPSQFVFSAEETAEERRARERRERRAGKIQDIQTYASTGGRDPLSGFGRVLAAPNEEAIKAEQQLAKERLQTADATLKALADEKKRGQSARGALGNRVGGALSSGIIGGGFPLLFGQGPGAAAGGAIGGLAGGALGGGFGFALSIVGTAVGDAFDEALNKGKTLAAGLSDPIGKFDELRQAGLISSKALEKNISSLIAQGREAEAAAKIQLDLANNFGDTSELTALNNAYDELGRAFSQLSVITAKFVAGPLADFINKLAASFKVFSARALFEERLQGASPEVQAAARRQVRQRASELSGSGLSLSEVGTEAYAAGLTFLDQQLGKTKEVQRAEAAVAAAVARQNTLRSLSFQQIDAQIQGYDRLNLELEKQRIEQQRLQDLSVPGADADRINTEAAQATYRVQSQINDLAKERVAIATEEAAKYQLAGEKLKQELQAVQALAALSQNAQRTAQFAVQQSTLTTIQGIEAAVGDARRREREIGAQISAARIRGGDAGEQEASRLVKEQELAADQTLLKLKEGSRALTEAGIKLREDADAAFLSLQRLRTGAGGLNQFLSPQDRVNQERQTFETLLPRFRVAQEQFRQLRGVNYAPEFTGTTAGINQSILQFIEAIKVEQQAVDTSVDTQQALNLNTERLATVNADLAAKVAELNAKEWVVQVSANVPYDAQSQLEINRASSIP